MQQLWFRSQGLSPQHVKPWETQKGVDPVVQQVWPLLQVLLPHFTEELAVAACPAARLIPSEPSTPPATTLPSSRRVCRREVGPARVRATSSNK